MSYFTYNGRSSADFGLHIEKKDAADCVPPSRKR